MGMRTVIMPSADIAPANTVRRGCLMAMMAAIMNVSSPSSVTRICAQVKASSVRGSQAASRGTKGADGMQPQNLTGSITAEGQQQSWAGPVLVQQHAKQVIHR